jgi:hypothetical protein
MEFVMSGKASMRSAEYWEGWQSVSTRQPCKYGPDQPQLRQAWAEGYADRVAYEEAEKRAGKVWWKSNTFRTAIICLTAGIVILLYGHFSGNGSANEIMSAGGGMSVGAILSMGIRKMLNDTPLYSGGGGGNSWYNNNQ